jgi:hypothetical protein
MRVPYGLLFVLLLCLSAQTVAQPCYGDYSCFGKKRTKFHLRAATGTPAQLRMNGVYLLTKSSTDTSKQTWFIRFSNNNSAFISCEYCSIRDSTDYNNHSYGRAARYMFKNDTLVLESFSAYLRYHYDYYILREGAIEWVGYSVKKKPFSHIFSVATGYMFSFKEIALTGTSNW